MHASIQAGAQDLVHGHSTGSSHRDRRGQSPLGQQLQPLRRAQRSSSGSSSSWIRPRYPMPRSAPDADPGTASCSTDSPNSLVGASMQCNPISIQSSASMSRRCAQQQQQQHVDDRAPQHAGSSPSMVGSSPERRMPAACASLPACLLITANDTRSPSSCWPAHPVSWLAALFASPRLVHVRPIAQVPRLQRRARRCVAAARSSNSRPARPSQCARSLRAGVFRAQRSIQVLRSGR